MENQKSKSALVALLLIVVVVLIGVVLYLTVLGGKVNKEENVVNSDKYQAVFLANGQVYFGHLKDETKTYASLTDIYYLQTQQRVQPTGEDVDQNEEENDQGLTLIKLGQELHGPEDEMKISRDQIIFWENLKADGKVVKAIEEHKSSQ